MRMSRQQNQNYQTVHYSIFFGKSKHICSFVLLFGQNKQPASSKQQSSPSCDKIYALSLVNSAMKKLSKRWSLTLRQHFNSNTWHTVMMITFIVFVSVALSIWLFWRSLYLPELKNHASYLAKELQLIDNIKQNSPISNEQLVWFYQNRHIVLIDNPKAFPEVSDKLVVDFLTDIFAQQIKNELGRDVKVYFKFKPTPKLWLQDSKYPQIWLQEPVNHYSQYSAGVLAGFVFGLPILTILTILILVHRLNRPLKKLERAATDYINLGHATTLPTHTGSNEIRKVNTAFNRLFTTLSQSQKERNIMLAGISHDLRTPLTRMRLTAEMLPDEFFREGLVYDIEDMDAILEQFISFMKDGSDEAIRPTNLETIFHEIMVQFSDTQFILNNSVNSEVAVRPLSIKRLIVNLVNNAVRYGREPIHLHASILPAKDESLQTPSFATLLLCVRDEGAGVADSELERIMQPFERGETARTTQGSGLGLAIVGRIVQLHHGQMSVKNHQDGGLQVCVSIPLLSQIIKP